MDSYFILDTKHLCSTPVQVRLLESARRGLDWQGRKAATSELQDMHYSNVFWLILYSARDDKPRVLQGFKDTLPTGKVWGKGMHLNTTHTCIHTRTHLCTYMHMLSSTCWHPRCVSSCHPLSLWTGTFKNVPHVLEPQEHRIPATFLAVNVTDT